MEENKVVGYISLEKIIETEAPLIVVLFPNYEDRTCAVFDRIKELSKTREDEITYLLFCFKNKRNNNALLEDLKNINIDSIKKILGNDTEETWVEYPSNFSSDSLKKPIKNTLEQIKSKHEQCGDVLFDISTTPKSVLFALCEMIKEFIAEDLLGRTFFAYNMPKSYSEVPYAQDIGVLRGLITDKEMEYSQDQEVHTYLFPSRTGHEGKLLCDHLDSISKKTDYNIFFPIYKDDFIESLDNMQANQTLMSRDSYLNYYYCTLDDAIRKLDELIEKEHIKIDQFVGKDTQEQVPFEPQVYVVAPFSAKIFLAVAYFELLYLQSASPDNINIEIANVKGFQYTSVYSLGIGELTCCELNNRRIAECLRKLKFVT